MLTDADGEPLPPCLTRELDDDGVTLDLDLDARQAPLFFSLPDDPAYTPYVRIFEAVVDDGYRFNSIRSRAELEDAGKLTAEETDAIRDLAVIDPTANVADPSGTIERFAGWMETLQLFTSMRTQTG